MKIFALANHVHFGLKWVFDLSWFAITKEKFLAVYKAAVPSNTKTRQTAFTNTVLVKFFLVIS